jgi:hypothetical protein
MYLHKPAFGLILNYGQRNNKMQKRLVFAKR